jgi:hypothetical protein
MLGPSLVYGTYLPKGKREGAVFHQENLGVDMRTVSNNMTQQLEQGQGGSTARGFMGNEKNFHEWNSGERSL